MQDCQKQWGNVSHVLRENNFQHRVLCLENDDVSIQWWLCVGHSRFSYILCKYRVNLLQVVNISGDCSTIVGPWPKLSEMYHPATNAVLFLILKHTNGAACAIVSAFSCRYVHIDDLHLDSIVLFISITESGPTHGFDYKNREAWETPPQLRHQPSWGQDILPYFCGSWSVHEVCCATEWGPWQLLPGILDLSTGYLSFLYPAMTYPLPKSSMNILCGIYCMVCPLNNQNLQHILYQKAVKCVHSIGGSKSR